MKYNASDSTVHISVGELCFIAGKCGDIDYRSYAERSAAISGTVLHKRIGESIKKAIPDGTYRTEIPLEISYNYNGLKYMVGGRADGVRFCGTDGTIPAAVDEYKTVSGDPRYVKALHLAQLKCYALFICILNDLDKIEARLVYCRRVSNADSGSFFDDCEYADEKRENEYPELKFFEYTFSRKELESTFEKLLDAIARTVSYADMRAKYVLPSAKDVPFPYPSLRDGQKELINECYRCIRKGKRLFVQAPTGIGKTVSVLYPAVKALGNGICDKIFYLTAKSSTRREAYNAASKLFAAGAHIRTIVISAKNIMCLNHQDTANTFVTGAAAQTENRCDCNSKDCPYAKGYGERVENAVSELISTQNCFTRGVIIRIAKKYRVCPYELSLDLSELCDLIICDYNYVFDPSVYFRRYFSDDPTVASAAGRFVFLTDEAHNLPERARDMYSLKLSCKCFEKAYISLPDFEKGLLHDIGVFIAAFRSLKKLCKNEMIKDSHGNDAGFRLDRELNDAFIRESERLSERLDKWLVSHRESPFFDMMFNMGADLHKLLKLSEIYDKGFLNYIEISDGDVVFKIFCLDPSAPLDRCLSKAHAAVMFSATLTPPDYFADILGGASKSVTLSLPSPFPTENLCLCAVTSVSTRFEDRQKSAKRIAYYIAATVRHRIGNYIVYFPSYGFMNSVLDIFARKFPNVPLIVQRQGMSAEEKKAFIDSFPEDRGKMRVGFCVLGGSFSEGIDLPGTRLIGAIIVGLGLPGLSNERNIIRDYFQDKYERGYDYAYTYPGMNNVLQAAGRVVRREDDCGVVVLIDDRYETPTYLELYPEHWRGIRFVRDPDGLSQVISGFWNSHKLKYFSENE